MTNGKPDLLQKWPMEWQTWSMAKLINCNGKSGKTDKLHWQNCPMAKVASEKSGQWQKW